MTSTNPAFDFLPNKLLRMIRSKYQDDVELQGMCQKLVIENAVLKYEQDRVEKVEKSLFAEKAKLARDQEKFELICYCNTYRGRLNHFEALFSRREFYLAFRSFGEAVKIMILIFNKERKEKKLSVLNLDDKKKDLNLFFRHSLTRIEKWRIILFWFFMDQIEIICTSSTENEDVFEVVKPLIKHIVGTQLKSDFENLKKSACHQSINLLKERCLSLRIGFKHDLFRLLHCELRAIATAFSEGYRRCSEEIKSFENHSAFPEAYFVIRKPPPPSARETESDYIINKCLNLIVNLGKE